MILDDILDQIGAFGRYQKQKYILLAGAFILTSPFMMSSVVLMGTPKHRCKLPGYSNDTYQVQSPYHKRLIDLHIPQSEEHTKDYDECHVFVFDQSLTRSENSSRPNNASQIKCSSWVYSDEDFDNTFVSEMNLVCDEKYKVSLVKTIFFGGVLVGSFAFGLCSDIIGRRKTLITATILLFTSSFALSWSPNYATYSILKFIMGMCTVGMFMTNFVIVMEWVGRSKRTFVGTIIGVIGDNGKMFLILFAYLVRQWKYTEICIAIPVGLYCICWLMVASMVFYGLTLNTGSLYGDLYINFTIMTVVDYPGEFFPYLLIDRFGRRKCLCSFMLIGGLGCLSTIFTVSFGGKDLQWLTTTLAMVGKMFSTACFAVLYIFSAELFPTVVRNAGMGSSSCWARIGGMISPFIGDMADLVGGKFGAAVPLVIFGSTSLLAGFLSLALPETLYKSLPDTIQDGKMFGRQEKETESHEDFNQIVEMNKYERR